MMADDTPDDTPGDTPGDMPGEQHADESASAFRSYVALAFVAVLVVMAVWLVNSFREHNRTIECFEAGRPDCVPFDASSKGSPR